MDSTKMPRKLWENPNPKDTDMWRFMQTANKKYNLNLKNFQELYKWSIAKRADFYDLLWKTQNPIHEGSYTQVVDESIPLTKLPKWYDGVRINWAENLLWTRRPGAPAGERSTLHKEDDKVAVTEVREGNTEVRHVTWGELRQRAGQLAGALKARGVGEGDRVVAVGSHSVQTLLVYLATTWLGGVFSSSSTDMGVEGLLQRTVQINPKFVFFDDATLYNGKVTDLRQKMAGLIEGMKGCDLFQGVVAIQRFDKPYDTSEVARVQRLEHFLSSTPTSNNPSAPEIARVSYQSPASIYYSSGTTGTPKAIVHGVGPMTTIVYKEAVLHRALDHRDVSLQYTTTGWIMYLGSIGHLLVGGHVVLYDGSPFMPDLKVLLKIVEEQRVTMLGTNPRWLGELRKNGIVPKRDADLSSLRCVVSTGMVLPDQIFEWFYDVAFPKSVHLGNISGGTDVMGCFGIENPLTPVYVGGCQGPGLGVAIDVFDHDAPEGGKARSLPLGSAGDLVATAAFPNMPICLWNDANEDGSPAPGPRYRGAYLSRFEGVWAQGDFCAIHPKTGAVTLLGRSDGVLNPSGVRFGSADIYAVLERRLGGEIAESICVGQRRPQDTDERVVLFLLMRPGKTLDGQLVRRIRDFIAADLTKRHVPKFIFEMPEVPVTVNGKKVELPVKQIISGNNIKPSGTLLNPKSLDFFYRFQKIEELEEPKVKAKL